MKRALNATRIDLIEVLFPPLVLVRWRSSFLQFQVRAIARQYRANMLGFLWALMVPLITLGIYAFVFGVIMQSHWANAVTASGAEIPFTLYLFAGLIVFWLIVQTTSEATNAIVNHSNLVKRAVFPLEIIPMTVVGTALFHTVINFGILLVATAVILHGIPITALLIPIVLAPLLLLLAGVAWFLAALGVYFRELGQIIGLLMTGIMFISPVLYPATKLPPNLQWLLNLNPVSFIATQTRAILLEGHLPNWRGLAVYTAIAWAISVLGLLFFRQARRNFADVL